MNKEEEQKEQVGQVQQVQKDEKEEAQGVQPDNNSISNSPFSKVILIGTAIVLIITGAIGGGYFLGAKKTEPKTCTQEAKICPDGNAVGRTGPNCEFAPCPTPSSSSQKLNDISNWKTYSFFKAKGYKLNEYSFSIKYPQDWILKELPLKPQEIAHKIQFFSPNKSYIDLNIGPSENLSTFKDQIENAKKYIENPKEEILRIPNFDQSLKISGLNTPDAEPDGLKYYNELVFLKKNQQIYQLGLIQKDPKEDHKIIFDQILSTFTFAPLSASKSTDQDEINQIDNWSIYSNDKFNFKYPSEYFVSISNQRNNFFQLFPKKMISKVDYIDIEYKENADYNKTVNSIKNKLDNVKTEKLKNGISVSGEFKKDLFYSALYNTAAVLINRGDLIVVETPQPKPEFFDQMISTFKFTE